jgi:hypothetical protein
MVKLPSMPEAGRPDLALRAALRAARSASYAAGSDLWRIALTHRTLARMMRLQIFVQSFTDHVAWRNSLTVGFAGHHIRVEFRIKSYRQSKTAHR